MPKYNYFCESCDHNWIQWNSMDDHAVECPHCLGKKVKKLPSSFFVVHTNEAAKEKTAKQNVIEHIEDNREIVKQMKRSAKNREYKKDV